MVTIYGLMFITTLWVFNPHYGLKNFNGSGSNTLSNSKFFDRTVNFLFISESIKPLILLKTEASRLQCLGINTIHF